jgi:hypothetical protein
MGRAGEDLVTTQATAGRGHRFVIRSIAAVTYKNLHAGTIWPPLKTIISALTLKLIKIPITLIKTNIKMYVKE